MKSITISGKILPTEKAEMEMEKAEKREYFVLDVNYYAMHTRSVANPEI